VLAVWREYDRAVGRRGSHLELTGIGVGFGAKAGDPLARSLVPDADDGVEGDRGKVPAVRCESEGQRGLVQRVERRQFFAAGNVPALHHRTCVFEACGIFLPYSLNDNFVMTGRVL